jgi:hypothetical protein
MQTESERLSLEELILSFHAGRPYLMWIHFADRKSEQPCAMCGIRQRVLLMTSPTAGICEGCWRG